MESPTVSVRGPEVDVAPDKAVDVIAEAEAPPPGAPKDHGRFPCVDGLRAVAAVAILVHHTAFWANGGFSEFWGPYYAALTVGVYVFFVISGFLLYRPYARSHQTGQPPKGLGGYLKRRMLRIYPAYWVALFFTMVILPVQFIEFSGTRETLVNYLLIQRYFSWSNIFAGLPQAWTLVTEASFYLFLPLYAWGVRRLVRRFGLLGELGALAALVAVGIVVQVAATFFGPIWQPLNVLPFFLPVFGAGMALAIASVWIADLDAPPPIFEWIGRVPYLWWGIALALFIGTVEIIGIPARGSYALDAAYTRVWAHTLIGFFLLVPAVFGRQDKGMIRGFLRWRPWAFLGVISYGLYLWHLTILALVRDWWWKADYTTLPVWKLLIPVFIFSVAVSTLSWYIVERPAIDLSRRSWKLKLRREPV